MLMATVIFFVALFTAFCCYFTYMNYSTTLLLVNMVVILVALILEQFVWRPLAILLMTLYISC